MTFNTNGEQRLTVTDTANPALMKVVTGLGLLAVGAWLVKLGLGAKAAEAGSGGRQGWAARVPGRNRPRRPGS